MKHIKIFNKFITESRKKTPAYVTDVNYIPSKVISDVFGLDLYTEYKFPDGVSDKDYYKYMFDVFDIADDKSDPVFKIMLDGLIKLNPELKPLKNEDPWTVLMGMVSLFKIDDIEYFCKTGGLMFIKGKEKDNIEKVFTVIRNSIPDYKGGWIPSPSSVQKILKFNKKKKRLYNGI